MIGWICLDLIALVLVLGSIRTAGPFLTLTDETGSAELCEADLMLMSAVWI